MEKIVPHKRKKFLISQRTEDEMVKINLMPLSLQSFYLPQSHISVDDALLSQVLQTLG
jgi:hypothetical protein